MKFVKIEVVGFQDLDLPLGGHGGEDAGLDAA